MSVSHFLEELRNDLAPSTNSFDAINHSEARICFESSFFSYIAEAYLHCFLNFSDIAFQRKQKLSD